jgi:hypothetical protein
VRASPLEQLSIILKSHRKKSFASTVKLFLCDLGCALKSVEIRNSDHYTWLHKCPIRPLDAFLLDKLFHCSVFRGVEVTDARATLQSSVRKSFSNLIPLPRSRENYYIAGCCCSWPLLLLPLVQSTSRSPTTAAWGAMAVDFSDDFKLSTGARHR